MWLSPGLNETTQEHSIYLFEAYNESYRIYYASMRCLKSWIKQELLIRRNVMAATLKKNWISHRFPDTDSSANRQEEKKKKRKIKTRHR